MTSLPHHYAAARRSYLSELAAAASDFANSIGQSRLWSVLAFNDILARYRGSILGPFWITISSAAFVGGISFVYADLMKVPAERYVPWMATGVVIWTLISSLIQDGSDAFTAGAAIIRQSSIPLPLFLWRIVFRNLLVFAHQIVVIFAVAIWFHYIRVINLPMAVFGLVLTVVNLAWIAFIAAVVAARFRDVQQVIITTLQLLFFITPVIWIPSNTLGARGALLSLNPINQMLEVTRGPLLGMAAPVGSTIFLCVMALVGWVGAFLLYGAVRRRIVHYL